MIQTKQIPPALEKNEQVSKNNILSKLAIITLPIVLLTTAALVIGFCKLSNYSNKS
jgi:hypothetical protein